MSFAAISTVNRWYAGRGTVPLGVVLIPAVNMWTIYTLLDDVEYAVSSTASQSINQSMRNL